jgi:hypothetical protein
MCPVKNVNHARLAQRGHNVADLLEWALTLTLSQRERVFSDF